MNESIPAQRVDRYLTLLGWALGRIRDIPTDPRRKWSHQEAYDLAETMHELPSKLRYSYADMDQEKLFWECHIANAPDHVRDEICTVAQRIGLDPEKYINFNVDPDV